jgi:hypothetical protein
MIPGQDFKILLSYRGFVLGKTVGVDVDGSERWLFSVMRAVDGNPDIYKEVRVLDTGPLERNPDVAKEEFFHVVQMIDELERGIGYEMERQDPTP